MKEKNKEEEAEFTNLLSDVELRASAAKLVLENPSDEKVLKIILDKQDNTLTDFQRSWIKALIKRNGKAWNIE
jgi:hypothetical protein